LHKIERIKKLQRYVNQSLEALTLGDWQVTVLRDPPDDAPDRETSASIKTLEAYRVADMRVSARFFTLPRHEQRQAVAHELTHLWFARLGVVCEHAIKLAPGAQEFFEASYTDAEEYAVEQISRLLVPRLALPPRF
jgi:hypothetical protein